MPRGTLAGTLALLGGWLLRPVCGVRDYGNVENLMMTERTGLSISFFYTKEEGSCFKDGDIDKLIGGTDSPARSRLLTVDMVVFLQLAKRPSSPEACEGKDGVPLGMQMGAKLAALGRKFAAVQIQHPLVGSPEDIDQGLLSVWYDETKVRAQKGFVIKNRFKSNGDSKSCISNTMEGSIEVTRDIEPCEVAGAWEEYDSTKSVIGLSFLPTGGEIFAVLGANLPIGYSRGKNEMTERAVEVAKTILGADKMFIIGDMNTRLLPAAWDVCADEACHEPKNVDKALQLIKPEGPLITPGKKKPSVCEKIGEVVGGYETAEDCQKALAALVACRIKCLGQLLCDNAKYQEAAANWADSLDTKRGADGYDILGAHFTFLPEREVKPSPSGGAVILGDYRWPSYKKVKGADNATYCTEPSFTAFCPENPCYQVASKPTGTQCSKSMEACFKLSSDTKPDILPPDDPVVAKRGLKVTKPQLGWLDALGYTKNWEVIVDLHQVPLEFTMGDHAPILAGVTIP